MNAESKVIQPKWKHTHTAILLHGRDSNAEEFCREFLESQVPDGRYLPQIFPSIKWVFLSAKTIPSKRFGCDMTQWFDMHDTQNPRVDEQDYMDALANATEAVIEVITKEAEIIDLDNTIIGGISQGCAVAIHALLRGSRRLGGFIGFSSWLPLPTALQSPTEKKNKSFETPVFLAHNQDDEVVSIEYGREVRRWFTKNWGMEVEWREFSKGGHWINEPDCVRTLAAFLANITDSCVITKEQSEDSI